ncbi:hypothetical protein AK812_SmicGene44251, partial [Symbiodinium microadriaticum]
MQELLQLRKELGKMKGFLLEVCEMLQESQEREAQLKETQATTLKQARAKLRDSESELQEKQAKLMQREADFERAMQDKEREFQQTARQQQVREKELRQREVAVAEREKVAASDSAARLLEYGAVLEMTCYASQAAANTAAAPSSRRTMSRIWPPVPLPSEPAPVSSVSKLEESLRQARLRLGITPQ